MLEYQLTLREIDLWNQETPINLTNSRRNLLFSFRVPKPWGVRYDSHPALSQPVTAFNHQGRQDHPRRDISQPPSQAYGRNLSCFPEVVLRIFVDNPYIHTPICVLKYNVENPFINQGDTQSSKGGQTITIAGGPEQWLD